MDTTTTAVTTLCGTGRTALVRAAIGLPAATPVDIRVDRVQHRLDGVSVGYDVRYGAVRDYLLASTEARARDGVGVALLSRDDLEVALWRHPGDPALPGLAPACAPDRVAAWLPGTTDLAMVTYRPLRRAVLRATGPDGVTGYLKVVRPHVLRRLLEQHDATAGLGAPRVIGTPAPGVVVLEALAGETLAARLHRGATAPTLADLLEGLGRPTTLRRAFRPVAEQVAEHVDAAVPALAPREAEHLLRLGLTVADQVRATTRESPVVLTHGDLHADNVLLDVDGARTGVLDVDRTGPGHLVDDVAGLLAHTHVAALLAPQGGDPLVRAAQGWWRQAAHPAFRAHLDPAALAARTAAGVLALVGALPTSAAPAALDLASRWSARVSTPTQEDLS